MLGSCQGLREIESFVNKTATSILREPTNIPLRTVYCATMTKRPSELEALKEFMKRIWGFMYEANHGEKYEPAWTLPLPEKNRHCQLAKLCSGMEWMQGTVTHLIAMATKNKLSEDVRIAVTTVKLLLPNQKVIQGGFLRETVADVLHFAKLHFNPDKRLFVQVREKSPARPLLQGEKTLAELKWVPGVILVVSLDTEEQRAEKIQQSFKADDPERLKRKAATIENQKQSKKRREDDEKHRKDELDRFAADRERRKPPI